MSLEQSYVFGLDAARNGSLMLNSRESICH
jgi:hypothetical protein